MLPDRVSYEILFRDICSRPASGLTQEELTYRVELAERLCRLMRAIREERILQMQESQNEAA